MSLDVSLLVDAPVSVHEGNITHNLTRMANAAGIYMALWRPEEINITVASQLIAPLARGLHMLQTNPDKYKALNPENGWGSYDNLVKFVVGYLDACRKYPTATVSVDR